MMKTKRKIFRIIALVFAVLGLIALIVSIVDEQSRHNYVLMTGMALVTIANLITFILNKKKQ